MFAATDVHYLPGGGLLATLVNARDTDGALSDEELVDLTVFLHNAGRLTTVSALTSLVYRPRATVTATRGRGG